MHLTRLVPAAVVLVHGAFSDTSSWAEVALLLRRAGAVVHTPTNPLRGLVADTRHLMDVVHRIDAPVVLVGHGYGGAVITQVPAGTDHVVALCYVAGFGLDAGECLLDITDRFAPMRRVHAALTVKAVGSAHTGVRQELILDTHRFGHAYADDLPPRASTERARAQRSLAPRALTDRSGPPAWARTSSWYAVAAADQMLNPSAQRFMAQRMAAHEHLLDASHAALLSQPAAVAAMIMEAALRGPGAVTTSTSRPR
ncbi:alpha/beta hydrolase [Streptomyces daghestanicus]|uniref:Alpha/beta hydrolase n=1 Tax=Streptomyces daghestanicus TaxID=66885 RepID=A0ABQ3Q403_9ACTN|nr:alpha/beta hydrolase [Streptomyces daghestanicus]GGU69872.1 alpha/beta hydrolase [Streptomyces daghestanicus]GHI31996.1 alpha/beta hydrolase [Streptomyces daghestanicus]